MTTINHPYQDPGRGRRSRNIRPAQQAAGSNDFVDVDVLVDPSISVSEGHRIGEEVLKRLNQDIDEVTDVTVHIDPEDDETNTPSRDAPMRGLLLERLDSHWRGIAGAEKIENVALHYFGGKISASPDFAGYNVRSRASAVFCPGDGRNRVQR